MDQFGQVGQVEQATPQTDYLIRRATPNDAARLSEFAERTFRETFAADNKPADMDVYCLQAFSLATQSAEIADPSIDTILLEDRSGTLVAYAQLRIGPTPTDVKGPGPIELVRFYVDRSHHGSGLAQLLMEEAIATASGRGARTIWLGVWERNFRARAFYRKFGFADVGDHEFHLGQDIQTDLVMALEIT